MPSYLTVQEQNTKDAMGQAGIYKGPIDVDTGLPETIRTNNNSDNSDNIDNDDEGQQQQQQQVIFGHMEYISNNDDTNKYVSNNVKSYTGSWKEGYWHGEGSCVLEIGDSYIGNFRLHERHGTGEYLWKVQKSTTTTTNTTQEGGGGGQGQGHDITTTTTATTTTKEVHRSYKGEFFRNQRQGQGTYTWKTILTTQTTTTYANDDDEDKDETNDEQGPPETQHETTTTTSTSLSKYVGSFDNGQRHGHGVYTAPQLQYTGEWMHGQYHGYGVLEKVLTATQRKSIYKGYFVKGKKEGRGIETLLETTNEENNENDETNENHDHTMVVVRHDGQWKQDKPVVLPSPSMTAASSSSSTSSSSSSSTTTASTPVSTVFSSFQECTDGDGVVGLYRGIIEQGLPQGVGTMSYEYHPQGHPQGIRQYEGFWQEGIRHGFGRLSMMTTTTTTTGGSGGDTYQGNFVSGKFHGQGEYKTEGGTDSSIVYKGTFRLGLPNGAMKTFYPHNEWYEGPYYQGQRDSSNSSSSSSSDSDHNSTTTTTAAATITNSSSNNNNNKNSSSGTTGKFVFRDGGSYIGHWKNGLYHGEGSNNQLITAITLYKGGFKDGKYHGTGCLTNAETDEILYDGEWEHGKPTNPDAKQLHPRYLEILQPPSDTIFVSPASAPPLSSSSPSSPSPLPQSSNHSFTRVLSKASPAVVGAKHTTPTVTTKQIAPASHESTKVQRAPPPPPTSTPPNNYKNQVEEPCKAVVDMAVLDGQDNPGRYTGLLHVASQRPHGVGRMVYNDGNRIHEGFWSYGHRQGHGRCLFVQIGDYHEGNYQQNLRHGPGKYLWKDGRQFVGNYSNDERQGVGTFSYPNGDVYEGNFDKGQRHGTGNFVFKKRTCRYTGEWDRGVYGGQGKLQWKTTPKADVVHIYQGEFDKGLFHGQGTEFTINVSDGNQTIVKQGMFDNGKFLGALPSNGDESVAKETKGDNPEEQSVEEEEAEEAVDPDSDLVEAVSDLRIGEDETQNGIDAEECATGKEANNQQ